MEMKKLPTHRGDKSLLLHSLINSSTFPEARTKLSDYLHSELMPPSLYQLQIELSSITQKM
jgi:hypothetical protein